LVRTAIPRHPSSAGFCPTRRRGRGSSCRKGTSIWSGIDGVGGPTLGIAGEQDAVTRPAPAARLAERLPNAELRSLDTGHAGYWERPEEVLALVEEFVAQVQDVETLDRL
jgi:pimeloyl-ACP methyl ester carboxylesterase